MPCATVRSRTIDRKRNLILLPSAAVFAFPLSKSVHTMPTTSLKYLFLIRKPPGFRKTTKRPARTRTLAAISTARVDSYRRRRAGTGARQSYCAPRWFRNSHSGIGCPRHHDRTSLGRRRTAARCDDGLGADLNASNWLVGHNIDYDLHVVGTEYYRLGYDHRIMFARPYVCTMQATIDFCNIPGKYGPNGLACKNCMCDFRPRIRRAHDAMADIQRHEGSASLNC